MSPPAIGNNNCQANDSAPNRYIEEHHGNITSNAVIPRERMTTSSAGPIYELPEELRPLHFRSEEEQKKHLTNLIDQALAVIEAGPGEDFLAAPSGADMFTTELAQ